MLVSLAAARAARLATLGADRSSRGIADSGRSGKCSKKVAVAKEGGRVSKKELWKSQPQFDCKAGEGNAAVNQRSFNSGAEGKVRDTSRASFEICENRGSDR
jgi:hypothetical protein